MHGFCYRFVLFVGLALWSYQPSLADAHSADCLAEWEEAPLQLQSEGGKAGLSERPDLAGEVFDKAGKPVRGARVLVFTAEARVGVNAVCPGCYLDCAKAATSAEDGSFIIRKLDSSLIFRLLVVRDGFEPAFVAKVDPLHGPIRAELKRLEPSQLPTRQKLGGRVVDPDGTPVIGAEISPVMFNTEAHRGFKPGIVDPIAVTNLRGEFLLTSKSPIESITVKVQARGLASKIFRGLEPAGSNRELKLGRGVTVTGRILREGKPLAGVVVGLVQARRTAEDFLGPTQIATDSSGRFTFSNVTAAGQGTQFPPWVAHNYGSDDLYYVYGIMSSFKAFGSLPIVDVTVGADESTTDVGDLKVGSGHRVAGRITLSDGKPVPPHTRLTVGRERAWDWQIIDVDAAGRFLAEGLPAENYEMSSIIKGYELSSQNAGASPFNMGSLEGRVDQNVTDLVILYEPSNGTRRNARQFDQRELRKAMDEFKVRRAQLIRGVNPAQSQESRPKGISGPPLE
jgi:hypothetical protein